MIGLLLASEKCSMSSACPAAESLPGGAEMPPPKSDDRSASENPASVVSPITPISSAITGRRYTPNVASSRLSSAAITVAAENTIDSPTRSTARSMAS
ncbi:MAG TPA: hypothetical protein VGL63_17595 [Streptosporangiaceae bacterium]